MIFHKAFATVYPFNWISYLGFVLIFNYILFLLIILYTTIKGEGIPSVILNKELDGNGFKMILLLTLLGIFGLLIIILDVMVQSQLATSI